MSISECTNANPKFYYISILLKISQNENISNKPRYFSSAAHLQYVFNTKDRGNSKGRRKRILDENINISARTGAAQWVEHSHTNWKVHGSIPSQGTCLGGGPHHWLGACKRQPINVSHVYGCFLPLFLPLFSLL